MEKTLKIAFTAQNVGVDLIESQEGNAIKIRYIVRSLQDAGHHVRLISLIGGRKLLCTDDLADPQYASLGFSGNRLFLLGESIVRRLQGLLHAPYLALIDTLRQYDVTLKYAQECDLIHEHVGLYSLGSTLAAARLNLPYVLNWEGDILLEREYLDDPLRGLSLWWARTVAQRSLRQAAALIVVTDAAKALLCRRWDVPAHKVFVLPNGVDTEQFKPAADAEAAKAKLKVAGKPVVMFVGSFWPWHGLNILVESFPRVREAVPTAQLVLVGDGQVRSSLEKQVASLHLNDAVHFTGRVPTEAVPDMLDAADIAVAPFPKDAPNSELGSPMKLYEYMAAGKAIVSSRIGQMPSVIDDGEDGLLVPPSDPDALADALIQLLQQPERRARLGEAARAKAVAHHSWQQFERDLEDVYAHALSGG